MKPYLIFITFFVIAMICGFIINLYDLKKKKRFRIIIKVDSERCLLALQKASESLLNLGVSFGIASKGLTDFKNVYNKIEASNERN
jgi:hypothetical protein